MFAQLILITALLAVPLAHFISSDVPSLHQPYIRGRNKTVLFITNSEHGLSNVHLATASALLVNHADIQIHFASFPSVEQKLERISSFAKRQFPSAGDITFHGLTGLTFAQAIVKEGRSFISPPGWRGIAALAEHIQLWISPWTFENHIYLYRELEGIIDEVDPAVIVLDSWFRPAIDTTRKKNRQHAFVTPNTLVDHFLGMQPLWRETVNKFSPSSGFSFPVPLRHVPENIYMNARYIYSATFTPDASEKKLRLREIGLEEPVNLFRIHRNDVPWITQNTEGAMISVDYVPQNVTCAGPILLSGAPASEQDPETANWLKRSPTILINLGSNLAYDEVRATAMSEAIAQLLSKTEVQVLWKFNKLGEYSDKALECLKPYAASGRVKMPTWLVADPASLLETGSIIASVHHGGSNCYHEAIAAGIPHVVLPLWADLYNYAALAEMSGVGKWVYCSSRLLVESSITTRITTPIMDPVSAFGLAGTIAQFVGFTAKLMSITANMHGSSGGAHDEMENIEYVYSKLVEFSSGLQIDLVVEPQVTNDGFKNPLPSYQDELRAIQELSASCRRDYNQLLGIRIKIPLKIRRDLTDRQAFTEDSVISDTANMFIVEYQRLQDTSSLYHIRQQGQLRDIQQMLDRLASAQKKASSRAVLESHEISGLAHQMSALSFATKYTSQQQAVIHSLGFVNRQARHEKISEAHVQTFRWTFEKRQGEEAAGLGLHEWLNKGTGVFWVSGKPGSGKSTFIKYVADNARTRSCLKNWAGNKELVIASHYFWISGTEMQKSWQGLIQTLLFDIFRQCPKLVDIVFNTTRSTKTDSPDSTMDPWSTTELRECLEQIKNQTDIPSKFCFFLDGLDEYDGEHLELCQDLLKLGQSPNNKICASSRPWNVFKDSFGEDPSRNLCIHQITRSDIRRYARSRLNQHPRWNLQHAQNGNAEGLIEEITAKSRGVFLWVFLVTRMLREGLTNDDTFSDLQKRLASFPSDLEEFFQHIVDSVEPFYHAKMASALQITLKAKSPFDLLIYSFHYQEFDNQDYALSMPHSPLAHDEVNLLREQALRRLNGHCRGLLERTGNSVDFLHRTVADFLRCRDMADLLETKTGPDFEPELSILRAYLAYIKSANGDDVELLDARITNALSYASSFKDTDEAAPASFEIIEEMEGLLWELPTFHTDGRHSGRSEDSTISNESYFRELVLQANLPAYLEQKLTTAPDYLDGCRLPPLHILLHDELSKHTEDHLPCPSRHYETLKVLLNHGSNPNELYQITSKYDGSLGISKTPWSMFIGRMTEWGDLNSPKVETCLESGILQLFLANAADPNVSVAYGPNKKGNLTASQEIIKFAWGPNTVKQRGTNPAYFSVLEAFLRYGASLPQILEGQRSDEFTISELQVCINQKVQENAKADRRDLGKDHEGISTAYRRKEKQDLRKT
ncbi:hypothetical protein FGRMN_3014 [Fusarium graminum]|nr:hypothetical protein FGRMN_3014 [Fusarium graminum]